MTASNHQKHGPALSEALAEARTGLFRATLLFGSIAAALALIVVPAADRHAKRAIAERLDPIATASTPSPAKRRYVVSRSVLQDRSSGPCLLFPDGTQRGAC